MATVSLTSGVRAALGSLSSIKDAASTSQFRLSTGKKVNSAVDDPVNFFTAAGLNDRASQLTKNLDGISNGIQTITAASQGIDSITKLVSSLQSTIKQAQADNAANRPTKAGTALATAAETALNSKSLKDTVPRQGACRRQRRHRQHRDGPMPVTSASTPRPIPTLPSPSRPGIRSIPPP